MNKNVAHLLVECFPCDTNIKEENLKSLDKLIAYCNQAITANIHPILRYLAIRTKRDRIDGETEFQSLRKTVEGLFDIADHMLSSLPDESPCCGQPIIESIFDPGGAEEPQNIKKCPKCDNELP